MSKTNLAHATDRTKPAFPRAVNGADYKFSYSVGELFAGAGGMALGASRAKYKGSTFRHTWVTDIDRAACETLRRNFPKAEVICSPVEELDFSNVPRTDGLAFGFPCNDFSIVGDRRGAQGKYGALYRYAVKALETLQPSFFVAENVVGLKNSNGNKDISLILEAFATAGYDIKTHEFHFEDYGIPQARHRVIMAGFKKSLGMAEDYCLPRKVKQPKTAREALENPPIPTDADNHELTAQSEQVKLRLKHIQPGENVFNAKHLPNELRLNLKSGTEISQIYRRLVPDKPAYTVTGSGGGGTHVYHWSEPRALTNRERARLQTFPDTFVFDGGKEAVRKQIGMAVPPLAAKLIFQQILKVLVHHQVASATC